MGLTTPNIGIYVPAAGETNYDASFLAGMVNIDQHDHSGPPNKGVPIASSGLADGSVTYPKLNPNVADNSTGIGTHIAPLANQLYLLGLLSSLYQLGSDGILVKSGTTALNRTITGVAPVTVTNGNGVGGNPTISLSGSSGLTIQTFTPTLYGGTTPGATTFIGTPTGQYIQIGNLYIVWITTRLNTATGTGDLTIGNLPAICNSSLTGGSIGPCICSYPYQPGCSYCQFGMIPGTNTAVVGNYGSGPTVEGNIQIGNFNNAVLVGTIIYSS